MRAALLTLGPIYLFMLSPLLVPIATITVGALSDAVRRARPRAVRPGVPVVLAPTD
jgi:hypothetical protein